MNKRQDVTAVKLMREIRDSLAKAEEGMSWKQRKEKLHRDLEQNPLWKRLKALVRPAMWREPASLRK